MLFRSLKEEVTQTLLPRAFSLARDTRVWIDPVNHLIVVGMIQRPWLPGTDASGSLVARNTAGKAIYGEEIQALRRRIAGIGLVLTSHQPEHWCRQAS